MCTGVRIPEEENLTSYLGNSPELSIEFGIELSLSESMLTSSFKNEQSICSILKAIKALKAYIGRLLKTQNDTRTKFLLQTLR